MKKANVIIVDQVEAARAVKLWNDAIAEWNFRESRDAPEELDPCGPVGGIEIIAGGTWRILLRHLETGRVYRIIAPRYQPYVTKPSMSFRRVPLDLSLVRRVERILSFERPNVVQRAS